MDEQTAQTILEKLASGEVKQYLIQKDDFLVFRNFLVVRPDFKHFRGVAQHSGDIIYYYMNEPRS